MRIIPGPRWRSPLNPGEAEALLDYFDGVDSVVSARLSKRRPASEPTLTNLLCDLLSEDELPEGLTPPLSLERLKGRLGKHGVRTLTVNIETHEYSPRVENLVTQADLGLIINVRNYLVPAESWTTGVLLQAKRAFPTGHDLETGQASYGVLSKFRYDSGQHGRMADLEQRVGCSFLRTLLYCPRPARLGREAQGKLAYLRQQRLGEEIFDYLMGLTLYSELKKPMHGSLASGLFVSSDWHLRNLGGVHAAVLGKTLPFAWFLVFIMSSAKLVEGREFGEEGRRGARAPQPQPGSGPILSLPTLQIDPHSVTAIGDDENTAEQLAHGIIAGNESAILELDLPSEGYRFAPPATITLEISVGHGLDPQDMIGLLD